MLKTLLLITFMVSANAFCEEFSRLDFEGELRALETNQLKTEELQMRNADAVTDLFTDEVGTGQAAVQRENETAPLKIDNSDVDVIPKKSPERVRRIRSR